MIEKKEFYIAPEVEIICFAPVENLAAGSWGWGWTTFGNGTGTTPDAVSDTTVEGGGSGDDSEYEGEED